MAFIVVFKSVNGEQLMSLTDQQRSGQDDLVEKALKSELYSVITLKNSSGERRYKIVGKNTKFAAPGLFEQKEQLWEIEFIVEPAQD